MKIVASVNGKGGVGKTTSLLYLALYLAETYKDKRILLGDLDNQANLTGSLMSLSDVPKHQNMLDLMNGLKVDPVVIKENLSLIPATNDLVSLDLSQDLDQYFKLSEELSTQFSDSYDLVLLDTPGNLGSRVTAALTSANVVFCPTELNVYSSQALGQLNKLVQQVKRRLNPTLHFAGLLANKVNGVLDDLPTKTDEKEIYLNLIERSPDKILGLVGKRACISRAISNGDMVSTKDDLGKKSYEEIKQFSEKLLKILG